MIRDSEGRYLSSDVIEGIHFFLLEKGYSSPNITNIHLNYGFYKTEFTHVGISDIGYAEVPEHCVKSFIRNKKINQIIE
jgi:hypothetical protein